MTLLEEFNKCTLKRKTKSGKTTILCRLGLWSVDGYESINVMHEAMHYFKQYKEDGEYSGIIGGKNTKEKLSETIRINNNDYK